MLQKVDTNTPEFKAELAKTEEFTKKVVKQFGYAFNPDDGINKTIELGLTRHKVLFGKRYCPCFVVTHTKEDRICPCVPAREHEIPHDGLCHCGIFCSLEYAREQAMMIEIAQVVHNKSRALTKEEAELLVKKDEYDADELEGLINARAAGLVDFAVVDLRGEEQERMIKGTDVRIPVECFYDELEKLESYKEKPIILYCLIGNRSSQCQTMLKDMKDMGFKHIGNLSRGFVSFHGEKENTK